MSIFVVDASVAIKWFFPEIHGDAALRLLFGEMADILLTGQRVVPKRATGMGFAFRHPQLGPALAAILGS